MTASRTRARTGVALTATLLLAGLLPVRSWTPPVAAQTPASSASSTFDPAAFDAYVREAVKTWDVPGLSIAVVKDGRVVFDRGYGVLALGGDAKVDTATLFAIGSTTKAMTAAAMGMLVDEGKVKWDDPVVMYLPWFRLKDPDLTRRLTVRDLLTHRAGLPNTDFLWDDSTTTTENALRRLRFVDTVYPFRSGFIYQNLMYATAGEVIEAVSGMPWGDFVHRRILAPLGMSRTVTSGAAAAASDNVAAPHQMVDGKLRKIWNFSVDPIPAAGAIWSSTADMSKWIAFLLRGCETAGGSSC